MSGSSLGALVNNAGRNALNLYAKNLRFSRRSALAGAGGLAAALGLGACTDTSDVGSSAGGVPSVSSGVFNIPNPKNPLPSGKASIRWQDSGDNKANFFKPFFAAYQKKHPNVSIDYNGSDWSEIQQVISLGIRNGSEPDVFQLPSSIPIPTAVANKWIGAYDDVIENWADIRKSYPPGVFVNGVTDFGGKTYALPLVGGQRFNNLLLYNEDHAAKSDVDFSQISTWDDFRTSLKKITRKGSGQYYGLIVGLAQSGSLSGPISVMAEMAGLNGGLAGAASGLGINWKTGEFNFTDPIAVAAVELFLAIHSDGSFFPGSVSLTQDNAHDRFPQGVAATMLDGPWCIVQWETENAGFPFGVNLPPQKDPNNMWPATYGAGGNGKWVFKAKSPSRPFIGDIFSYISSDAAQTIWGSLDRAADPPPRLNSLSKAKLTNLESKGVTLAKEHMVIAPEPAARNRDVSLVYQNLKPPTPSYSDVIVGLITGQIKSGVQAAMKDLDTRYNKALDAAIALTNHRGGKVSRDDFVLKDWDPKSPYSKLYGA